MSDPNLREEPAHLLIPVDKEGNGPVPEEEQDHIACWCGMDHAYLDYDEDGNPFDVRDLEHPDE